jgi:hypothetical protein
MHLNEIHNWVKRLEPKAYHSPPSNAKVKNELSYTPLPQ